MRYRGINYDVGVDFNARYRSRPSFDPELVRRELAVIRDDLCCNAVRISGTDPGRLSVAAVAAGELGLEVWLSPHLHDCTPEETLRYTVSCAQEAEKLRQQHVNIAFILGCELTWFMQEILPGDNFMERLGNPLTVWWRLKIRGMHNKPLNTFLSRANRAVREARVHDQRLRLGGFGIDQVDLRIAG